MRCTAPSSLFLLALLVAACARISSEGAASPSPVICASTPTSSATGRDGSTLIGLRGGDVFLYTIRAGPFYADPGEKFFALLDKMPENPNSLTLLVEGRNQSTGSKLQVRASSLQASWGNAWGGIYRFPDAGCWTLTVDAIGPEHLLLAVIRAGTGDRRGSGSVGDALNSLGVDVTKAREALEALSGRGDAQHQPSEIVSFTPEGDKVIDLAPAKAKLLNAEKVTDTRVLLAVLREPGKVGVILQGCGVSPEAIRQKILGESGG